MTVKELLTYEDIPLLPKEGRYEVVEGRLVEMSPAGGWHGYAVAEISAVLREKLRGRGYVLSGEVGLVINREPLTLRASDIAFYSKERLREIPRGLLHEPPDLVVEVIAEETSMEYFEEKLRDYMSFGVGRIVFVDLLKRLVLVVDEERRIAVYTFEEEVEFFGGVRWKVSQIVEG
ncbi:MAG: Uma2 family endonuclease, partial [Aquificota bacterium]